MANNDLSPFDVSQRGVEALNADKTDLIFKTSDFSSFLLNVQRGKVAGHSIFTQLGHNEEVDTTNDETIYEGATTFIPLAVAETIDFSSDNINDTAGGAGVQSLKFQGLDGNFNEISEIRATNGASLVTTVNSYIILHRVDAETAGSNLRNIGNITFFSTTTTKDMGLMRAQLGSIQNGFLIIPANKTAHIFRVAASVTRTKGTQGVKEANVDILVKEDGKALKTFEFFGLRSDGGAISINLPFNKLLEKTFVRADALAISNNTAVSINFAFVFIDN